MVRLDVYPAPGRTATGFVVDVQADLLADLATRLVVPLLPNSTARAAASLNPIYEIDGRQYVLMVQSIATAPRRGLRGARIAHRQSRRDSRRDRFPARGILSTRL